MRLDFVSSRLLAPVLLVIFGYRAATGLVVGLRYQEALRLDNEEKYGESAPLLERCALGANFLPAMHRAASARVGAWDNEVRKRGPLGGDPAQLEQATSDFLTCLCAAPGARYPGEGLAQVYDSLEWIGRERRAEPPLHPVSSPWERVGRPGRIALGIMRNAERQLPNWFGLKDKMALTLWAYGLEPEAREAVRASARAYPLFGRHWFFSIEGLPAWFGEEFAQASWEALGQAPFVDRSQHLIDLGKQELRIGNHARAIEALEAALGGSVDATNRAEADFNLGLAYGAEGEGEKGMEHLRRAVDHPVFRVAALMNLATAAELSQRDPEALGYLRMLRRERPDDPWPCLKMAEVARRLKQFDVAIEALMWVKLKAPRDPQAYEALVEVYLDRNDPSAARSLLTEMKAIPDLAEVSRRLSGKLDHTIR